MNEKSKEKIASVNRLLDAYTANLLAGEDELADGIREQIVKLFMGNEETSSEADGQ